MDRWLSTQVILTVAGDNRPPRVRPALTRRYTVEVEPRRPELHAGRRADVVTRHLERQRIGHPFGDLVDALRHRVGVSRDEQGWAPSRLHAGSNGSRTRLAQAEQRPGVWPPGAEAIPATMPGHSSQDLARSAGRQ